MKWRYNFDKKLSYNQVIYLADTDGSTIKIPQQDSAVLEFKDDHEEANTQMFANLKYSATRHLIKKIIIVSPDTYVTVVCFQKISCLESIDEIRLDESLALV